MEATAAPPAAAAKAMEDPLQGAMLALRQILTKANSSKALTAAGPHSPDIAKHPLPGTHSPPMSGCSDVSTPDRYSLRQQQQQQQRAAEAHTPCSKRNPLQAPPRTSYSDAAALDLEQINSRLTHTDTNRGTTNRAQSFSAADLDAAAAMLELPSAYTGGSKDGARGSSHSSDSGSQDPPSSAAAAAATTTDHAAVPTGEHTQTQGGYATDLHASIADASAESAAELLLAAGRLASVSSQTSRTDAFHISLAKMPSYSMSPSAAAAAPSTAAPAANGTDSDAAAAAAGAGAAGSYSYSTGSANAAAAAAAMMGYAGGYFDTSVSPMGPGTSAAAAAAPVMYSMANRPPGCSCLKPCKPHNPCQQCGSPHSPGHTWRAGPGGPGTLCNACGTRYSRSKQKQMAAAAAAAAAAASGAGELLWSGSNGGSSSYVDGLSGSSGVGKSMKGKQSKINKAASSRVVKGSGGRASRGGAGAPYGVLAALERRWAQGSNAYGGSAAGGHSGGGGQGSLEGQGSFSEEQQQWVMQWQMAQQQYEQQYSQQEGQEAVQMTAEQLEQQQQQQWMLYNSWMQQQQEQQR